MAFITKDDFPPNVHTDILDALTRGNDDVITDNAARSIDEVKAYLNGRYDTNAIFSADGDNRNKYILRITTTIALYYIYLIHNPRKLHQAMVDEFERAIETLEKIQKGVINPEGLPLPANEEDANSGTGQSIQWGSDAALNSSW
ncbi:MAG TPA: DUF1320 family protein [Ferruginibacter sp.]|nr:DUF1320 family protein [Ferruginibacter sp.]HMP22186.1 DUF1320 family protein [Ferruginibacter sp.]